MTARKSKRTTAWRKRKRIEELNARTMDKKEKNQKTQKKRKTSSRYIHNNAIWQSVESVIQQFNYLLLYRHGHVTHSVYKSQVGNINGRSSGSRQKEFEFQIELKRSK